MGDVARPAKPGLKFIVSREDDHGVRAAVKVDQTVNGLLKNQASIRTNVHIDRPARKNALKLPANELSHR